MHFRNVEEVADFAADQMLFLAEGHAPTSHRERMRMAIAWTKMALASNFPTVTEIRYWMEGQKWYTFPLLVVFQLPDLFYRFRISLTIGARCWRMNSWRHAVSSYLANIGQDPSQPPTVKGAQVAQICLNAVFDEETIFLISKQAHRMSLYDARNTDKLFNDKLSPKDVKRLMKERVSAFSLSYKHKRRSASEVPEDRRRLHTVVRSISAILGRDRLLFWADVTGKTKGTWAEQGIEPYLIMPTVRVVSSSMKEKIDLSFWMHLEQQAARYRGGLVTFDEEMGHFLYDAGSCHVPSYASSLALSRINLARAMFTPAMHYLKSMWEQDKLDMLKYAVQVLMPNLKSKEGLLFLQDNMTRTKFLGNVLNPAPIYFADMPKPIYQTDQLSNSWNGIEEMMPAVKVVDAQSRFFFNFLGRDQSQVLVLSQEGLLTELLISTFRVLESMNCNSGSVLRLEVEGYEDSGEQVSGHVVNYRAAWEREEEQMQRGSPVHRYINFDKDEFIATHGHCLDGLL